MEEKVIKLEIGSGKFPHDGYTTIDIEESNKPDIVGDFRGMNFENIDEIRAHHLLEHFGRDESVEVLKQWRSWLKAGGRLIVETPDFERICSLWSSGGLWANNEWLARHCFGSQEAEWAYHKDGWYKEKFEKIFPMIGFEIELLKQKHSYVRYGEGNIRYRLPNILVIAKKL